MESVIVMPSIKRLTEDYRECAYASLVAFCHDGRTNIIIIIPSRQCVSLQYNRLFARRAKWVSVSIRYYALGYFQNNRIAVRRRFANKGFGY